MPMPMPSEREAVAREAEGRAAADKRRSGSRRVARSLSTLAVTAHRALGTVHGALAGLSSTFVLRQHQRKPIKSKKTLKNQQESHVDARCHPCRRPRRRRCRHCAQAAPLCLALRWRAQRVRLVPPAVPLCPAFSLASCCASCRPSPLRSPPVSFAICTNSSH